MLLSDLLGFGNDVSQARLPLTADTVIDSVSISDDNSFELLAEDVGCKYRGNPL